MDQEFVFAAAADERRQLADLLDHLDDDQLAIPSLCEAWDVKAVGAHLACGVTEPIARFLLLCVRTGSVHRASEELTRRRARRPTAEITAALRDNADKRLSPPGTGPRAPLADLLVHGGDIRIPLGLPFEPDPDRVAVALDFLTGPRPVGFVPKGRLAGLSLHGTDEQRVWGSGDEVRGPVAALMMAACGRTATLPALNGAGLSLLRPRLGA